MNELSNPVISRYLVNSVTVKSTAQVRSKSSDSINATMSSLAFQCRLRLFRLQLRRSLSGPVRGSISHVRSKPQLSRFKLDHQRRPVKVQLFDESFADFPSLIEEDRDFSIELPQPSSSEGEESDDDYYVNPYLDVDLPASKKAQNRIPDAALVVAAHSLRGNRHGHKKRR